MTSRKARKILQQAVPFVGEHVVIVGVDYLSSSIAMRDSRAIQRAITLVDEAKKRLTRMHRHALNKEKQHGTPEEPAG